MAEIDVYAWPPDVCRDCARVGLVDGWVCLANNHPYDDVKPQDGGLAGYASIVIEIPYVHLWELVL